jgi:hypothetical protein
LLDGLWLESGLNPGTFTPEQGVQICEAWVDGLQAGGRQRFTLPAEGAAVDRLFSNRYSLALMQKTL